MAHLSLHGVSRRYGSQTVVQDLDLSIPAGASSPCSGPAAAARPPRCA